MLAKNYQCLTLIFESNSKYNDKLRLVCMENKYSKLGLFYFDQKDCLKRNNLSMAYRKSNSPFFTPERKTSPEKTHKGLSTTIGSRFSKIQHLHQSSGQQLHSNADGQSGQNEVKAEKNTQRRPEIINNNEQINENLQSPQGGGQHLRNHQKLELREEEDQGLMLREIGSKVLGQIKENSRLRRSANNLEVRQLRISQKNIHSVIQRASTSPPVPLQINEIEDNPYMKDYIQKTNKRKEIISSDHSRESSVKKGLSQQKKDSKKISVTPEPKAPLFNEQLLSVQRLQNLKKYFTLYVNTAIESNDDKFAAEQKYIETLEKRLARLQQYEQTLDHFKFEKRVKLQESNQKSKNLSIAGPIVKGDLSENVSISEQTPPTPVQHSLSHKYFPTNERIKIIHDPELLSELMALREENKNLKELYQIVKYNFQREIADHIKDNSEREHLVYRIQKLEAQNCIIREQSKIKKGSYATNT